MNKILVVDDDLDILEVLKYLLKKNNFDVVALSEAQKVIDTTVSAKPDVVLLDINLSGYDGREICKYLKTTLHVKTPIILFSANAAYKNAYKDSQADDFIEKPFEIKKLLGLLHSHLPAQTASTR